MVPPAAFNHVGSVGPWVGRTVSMRRNGFVWFRASHFFSGDLADEACSIVSCEGNLLVMKGSGGLGVRAAIVID